MDLTVDEVAQLRKVEQKLETYLASARLKSQPPSSKSAPQATVTDPELSNHFANLFSEVERLQELSQDNSLPPHTQEDLDLEHILHGFWVSLQNYLSSPTVEAWNDVKVKASSAYLQIHQYYETEDVERALPDSIQPRPNLTLVKMGSTTTTRPQGQSLIEWAHAEMKSILLDVQKQKESNSTNIRDPFSNPYLQGYIGDYLRSWISGAEMRRDEGISTTEATHIEVSWEKGLVEKGGRWRHNRENDFGPPLTKRIAAFRAVEPIQQPSGLKTLLQPHQLIGTAKMMYSANSIYRGSINGDEMGMGKTLQAIAMIVATPRHLLSGPWLVVTTKALISHWVSEFKGHVKPEVLQVGVLSKIMTSEDIQRFDVIIVSYSKLAAEYGFLTRQQDPLKRSYTAKPTPILSSVHEEKYRPFQGMFLDESQVVKNTATVIHKAVDSVFRRSTQCLTGTLLHNRWDDAYGNIRLLSGHPVQSQKFFYGTFGSFDYITGKAVPPKPSQIMKLQKFLMAFTFVRPNTVLQLPPHEFKKVEFELRIEDLRESNQHVVNFKNQPQGEKARHSLDVEKKRQMSMGSLIRAQQYACHSWLTQATSKEAQDVENAPPTKTKARRANKTKKTMKYGKNKSQFTRPKAYLEFLKGRLSDNTGRDDEKEFEQWDAKSDISVGSNDSVWSKDGIEDELAELQTEARTYEYNPNSIFAHYENDQIADGDSEVEESALQGEDHEFLPQVGGKSYEDSKKWIDDMVKEDALLRSGRMQCFLKEYRRIITDHMEDKIVIWSQFQKLLDIAAAILEKEGVGCYRWDGTNPNDRDTQLAEFKADHDKRKPLMITATAGSTGLNIPEANRVIQLEPWWNYNTQRQAHYRVLRYGQRKKVHITVLVGRCDIDGIILAQQEKKTSINKQIWGHLVYDDTDPSAAIPAIPAQDWAAREVVRTKHGESGSDTSEEEDSDNIDSASDLE